MRAVFFSESDGSGVGAVDRRRASRPGCERGPHPRRQRRVRASLRTRFRPPPPAAGRRREASPESRNRKSLIKNLVDPELGRGSSRSTQSRWRSDTDQSGRRQSVAARPRVGDLCYHRVHQYSKQKFYFESLEAKGVRSLLRTACGLGGRRRGRDGRRSAMNLRHRPPQAAATTTGIAPRALPL